jgi:hypothetical protein
MGQGEEGGIEGGWGGNKVKGGKGCGHASNGVGEQRIDGFDRLDRIDRSFLMGVTRSSPR